MAMVWNPSMHAHISHTRGTSSGSVRAPPPPGCGRPSCHGPCARLRAGVVLAVPALFVLAPINAAAGAAPPGSGLFAATTARWLPSGHGALWAHVAFAAAASCAVGAAAMRAHAAHARLRVAAAAGTAAGCSAAAAHSVLVTGGLPVVPGGDGAAAAGARLAAWADAAGFGPVVSVLVLRDRSRLHDAWDVWEGARRAAARSGAERDAQGAGRRGRRCAAACLGGPCCPSPLLLPLACCGAARARAARARAGAADAAAAAAAAALAGALEADARGGPPLGRSILTFARPGAAAAVVAASRRGALHRAGPLATALELRAEAWAAEDAPEPGDVHWRTLCAPPRSVRARRAALTAALGTLLLLLSSPAAFIAAFQSAGSRAGGGGGGTAGGLRAALEALESWAASLAPGLAVILLAYLPTLLAVAANALLLYLIWAAAAAFYPSPSGRAAQSHLLAHAFAYLVLSSILLPSLVLTTAFALLQVRQGPPGGGPRPRGALT